MCAEHDCSPGIIFSMAALPYCVSPTSPIVRWTCLNCRSGAKAPPADSNVKLYSCVPALFVAAPPHGVGDHCHIRVTSPALDPLSCSILEPAHSTRLLMLGATGGGRAAQPVCSGGEAGGTAPGRRHLCGARRRSSCHPGQAVGGHRARRGAHPPLAAVSCRQGLLLPIA